MSVIKQIATYDGSTWTTDDIGANASNVSLSTNVAGQNNVQSALSKIVGTSALTANKAVITGASGVLTTSNVTSTQLGYLSDVSSNIQTQIDTLNTNLGNCLNTITDNYGGSIKGSDNHGIISILTDGTVRATIDKEIPGVLQINDNWQDMTGKSYNLNDYKTVGKYYFPSQGGTLTNQPNGADDGWLEVLPVMGTNTGNKKQIWHRLGSQKKVSTGYPSYFDEAVRIFGQGKTDGSQEWSKWAITSKFFDGQTDNYYYSNGDPISVSVPNSTYTIVNSYILPQDGYYLVISAIEYATNGNGLRYCFQSDTTSANSSPGFFSMMNSNSSYQTVVDFSGIWAKSKGDTIRVIAWQNSGAALNTRSVIYLLKIGSRYYTGY